MPVRAIIIYHKGDDLDEALQFFRTTVGQHNDHIILYSLDTISQQEMDDYYECGDLMAEEEELH